MSDHILALDQGTTSSRAIVFDRQGRIAAMSQHAFSQHYPQDGWVEHDPMEIWETERLAAAEAIAGFPEGSIAGIGVTNQRETTILWDKATGQPVYNAIVWQCRRTAELCEDLKRQGLDERIQSATGLLIDAYFSGSKIRWILDNVPGVRRRAERGEVLFGTVETWLIWQLTGVHVTDYSNASRTQLFNIRELKWDEKLLEIFGLQDVQMPEVHFSDEIYGYTTVDGIFDEPIPVAGDMGDSHGALFAQMCWERGMGKCSFGTGGSLMVNIGDKPMRSASRLNTSIAWGLDHKVSYVFEGTIVCMGDTIRWLKDQMELIDSSAQSGEFAEMVDSTQGVYLVPAFTGLGAPYWQSNARAMICGMNRFTDKRHIVRAGVESITYQMRDIIEPMMADADFTLGELRVDGGPTNNKFLMQFTADILNTRIVRNKVEELSALGSAFAGGLATGFYKSCDEIAALRQTSAEYVRAMPAQRAEELYKGWKDSVDMLISGIK